MADAFEILAEHATETGNHAKAPAYYEKALALYKQIGDLVGMGDALKMMGWSAMRVGDYGKAEPLLNEGLIACRESGDLHQIASGLSGLGELAIRQGQLARAKNYLLESLNISRTLGEKWGPAISLGSLGWVALLQKDFPEMRKLLGESLAIRMETEDRGGTAWCLEKLAEGASLLGDSEKAVLLYGAAAGLRATVNSAMDLIDQPDYERVISKLQANLGKEEFAKLWAGGGAMELADVIELGSSDPSARQSAREKYGGLTAREREVAALIAQGKSNREIAKEMTVGVKTVETYVTRMLDKLGFDSRVQIATWMIEKEK
jgi:non-specific serine/threonine protein kinase